MLRFLAALVLEVACTLFVLGCGSAPPAPPLMAPDVRLGPTLDLLRMATTGQDKVRLVAEGADRVHVLIASAALAQVFHVVVGPDGVAAPQVIRSNARPSKLDGTFDATGRLHALLDEEHLVLQDGRWRSSERSVWQDAGVKADRPSFVQGARDLVWTFAASGASMAQRPDAGSGAAAGAGIRSVHF